MRLSALALLVLSACPVPDAPADKGGGGDLDTEEGDADTDTDTDSDADGDSDSDSDGDTDTDTDTDTGCPDPVELDATLPEDGANDAYYRSDLEFELSDPDPSATIETDIPGHAAWRDDETLLWVLDAPLAPSTAYEATIHFCGGDETIAFTTSALGEELADPAALTGRTYRLDLADARVIEPPGIGSVLTSYLTQDLLLGVDAVDGATIRFGGALAAEDSRVVEQDFCSATFTFPEADFADAPYFAIGPQTTTFSVAGYELEIQELEITGTFAPDGSYFGGGTFSGVMDTRPLDPLVGDEEGAICDLALAFGASCEACSDGEPFCLGLVLDEVVAEAVDGLTLHDVMGVSCTGCDTWTEETVPAPDEQECPA